MFSPHIQSQMMKVHQHELAARAAVQGPHRFMSAGSDAKPAQSSQRRHFVWLRVPRRAAA
jgi:hypothetical protein